MIRKVDSVCSMKYLLSLFLASAFFTACTDTALVDKNIPIAKHEWRYEDPVNIDVHVSEIDAPYRVYLNLRHTPDYRYANIFMLVHVYQPNGTDTTERIELTLAEPDGRWLGSGAGSIYTHQQLIKDNYFFPDTGQYTFSIEQNMRENPLPEIADVGIRIEPAQ